MTAHTTNVPGIELNNGVTIPQFGFGVFQIPPEETAEAVRTALDAGYRHFDTAQMYRNEEGVGEGIRSSGVPREEVFVTTKLANDAHGHDNAINALEGSLRRLGLDYVDLYLIHWPLPHQDKYVKTWEGFEELARAGKARSIGVSNFQLEHLEELARTTGTVPAVNQVELHPALQQTELRAYHRAHGIATEAWSPLAQAEVLSDPVLTGLAEKYGKSAAQVVLRWHLQLGNIVFPKSATPARIRENIDVFDFELDDADADAIGKLDADHRIGPDPDTFRG
ncbi:aldo/keto reductase [Amycolatopsis sp. FDAARGOS 1241]|uniref:aldo/keto reductase n=1 Tax=Amycolatopsis sp. FDAARGOS 1241 TaxID=2778070 RepID=UPI00194FFC4F|nr:aldo/keto reductase [Amycolatopsis sp. FDAARGOS 1241]QRP43622.1 aldo/keto reductase [Amycolatopsis sp. FDAARGOS 1241]